MARASTKKSPSVVKVAAPDRRQRKHGRDVNAKAPTKGKGIIKPTEEEYAKYGVDPATAAMNELLSAEYDALEVKYEMVGGSTHSLDKVSSDSLALDLVTGGGFTPTGINQMAGFEAAGKTTTILHTLGRALTERNIGYIGINDAENTVDIPYLEGIFGPKFDKILMGSLRYSDQEILEPYFDFIRSVIKTLPDKIWLEDLGGFAYRLNLEIPKHKAFAGRLADMGIPMDKNLSNKKFSVYPTEDTKPQALFVLDSFPALITGGADDRESDESGGMSERARKLAEVLPKFTGRMRRKGVCLVGTNQLREKPGVTHGDPVYEPMGNTLKFASAQRTRVTTRSSKSYSESFRVDKEATQLVVEDNPLGGKDYYSFKEFKNTKNKAGSPFLRAWTRIWTADPHGQGHGIDPVFDLWEYLSLTGQVKGGRTFKKGFTVLLPGIEKALEGKTLNWHDFKLLVLAEKYGGPYAAKAKEKGFGKVHMLAAAWKQRGKVANDLRAAHAKAVADGKIAKDGDEE